VVPQLTITTFAAAWLVLGFDWRPAAAGLLAGAAHLLAGVVRVLIGSWSDLLGTRMPLMRLVLAAGAAALVLLGLGSTIGAPAVALGLVVTTVTTQMPNGLAFTAVAERAGPRWSGRAIGFQNTGQFVVTTAVGPIGGAAITWLGYGAAVGLTAALSAAAVLVAPRRDEHAKEEWS
jgi:MFS family permease